MAKRMPYIERRNWLLARIAEERGSGVDVLDADFVADYVEHSGSKSAAQFFGASKCTQLGQDLGRMYRERFLNRSTAGIGDGLSGMGFPKWVYSYRLSTLGAAVAARHTEVA